MNRLDWKSIDLPALGKLISDGILNTAYASLFQFETNEGGSYQTETSYRLVNSKFGSYAYMRWKINFDEVDFVDVKWKKVSGESYINFRITSEGGSTIYSSNTGTHNLTINVASYKGVNWLGIYTTTRTGAYDFFDIELRKAE